MALIGVSYSVAAFPQMAKLFAQGEQAAFMSYTREALRHILFWSIPIATLFVVLRAHIVRVILGSGNFSWDDTRLTAAALAIFAIAVVCQSVVQLLDRAYYATGETRTPVVAKIGSAVIAAGLGLLSPWLIEAWPRALDTFALLLRIPNIVGAEILLLPLVFTLAAALNMGYLWWKFATTLRASLWIDVDRTLRESLLASLVMGLTTYVALTLSAGHFDLSHTLTVFLAALFAGVAGMGAGVLVLVHVKSREFSEIAQATHRRLRRILPMLPGPEDLP
ncbi:MAG: hypothetical protein A2542_02570 [Parcubacteria group bacterium RIFOXYD2_FULL_52_8]|nr:MAG: hypothetical protein A2542_02570 [Parcubacteria group bacterium RIFOXYD2_FULL_52_8]